MAGDLRDIEIKRLRTMLAECTAVIADRDAKIEKLTVELNLLRAEFERSLRGRMAGLDIPEGQGLLFDGIATEAGDGEDSSAPSGDELGDEGGSNEPIEEPPPPSGPSKPDKGRKIDTTGLQREIRIHELEELERICPVTGCKMIPVGMKTTEELDYRRASLIVIEHQQVIYGLSADDALDRQAAPLVAPRPAMPLARSIASAMLLAWLLVQKYANHLPLYRQTNIFGRDGLRLPRQTLCDWTMAAAEALEPIVEHMLERVRAGPVLQIDDTPVQCQAGRGEENFQARLWAFVNPKVDGVVYRFTPGRAADTLAVELGNFVGTLVGDGYVGNHAAASLIEQRRMQVDDVEAESIKLAGCWAHAVRKFRDAESEDLATATLFRDDIREIFDVEDEAATIDLNDEGDRARVTLELRLRKSASIVVRTLRRTSRLRSCFDKAGLLGGAMGYLRGQRSTLIQFLRDGNVPAHNNACERAIRTIAVGRRNWLFTGSMRGGRAAAVIYTLIESCNQANVDPVDYLADVLARVRRQPIAEIEQLVPAVWAPAPKIPPSAAPAAACV